MVHLYGVCRITHFARILITETFKKYLSKMKRHFQVKLASFCKVNASAIHPTDQSTLKFTDKITKIEQSMK